MKIKWYKFWKKFGPHTTKTYIFLDPRIYSTEKEILYECRHWAKCIPGGHCRGYDYGFEEVNSPPLSELEKMIERQKEFIDEHKEELKILRKTYRKAKKKK